jgi:polyisoprenoid-binding protein YceI
MFRSKRARLLAGVGVGAVVVLAVAGFAGWWFFIRDDAPPKATIDEASKTLDEGSTSSDDKSSSSDDPASVDGDWKVDPKIGSFDDFSGTFAGYRIKEELATIGGTTAVARTPDVTGGITIAGNKVTTGSFTVDMTTLQSDQDRRDNAIRDRGLETNTFKTSTFKVTQPIALPANATSGTKIKFSATGDLTLHGVTKSVTISFDARFKDGEIAIVGNTPIHLSDYKIEPPTNFMALSVSSNGTLEFQLFLKKG